MVAIYGLLHSTGARGYPPSQSLLCACLERWKERSILNWRAIEVRVGVAQQPGNINSTSDIGPARSGGVNLNPYVAPAYALGLIYF